MPKSTNPFAARRKSSATSSPFSTLQRTKSSLSRSNSKAEDDSIQLPDTGFVPSLAPSKVRQDVISLIRYIQSSSFSEIPDRAAGMNSTRISEIHLFRRTLPPVVSLAHLMAVSKSATATERELAMLVAQGTVRRVLVPGRGKGGAAVGEGVVVVEDWKERVRKSEVLGEEIRERYMELLDKDTSSKTASAAGLTSDEVKQLVAAGFLTNPSALSTISLDRSDSFDRPVAGAGGLSSAGHKAPTGSLAAVGGYGAIYANGGTMTSSKPLTKPSTFKEMTLSLPSTGSYLHLLTAARQHLLFLLRQLSPRHKEATLELLKEKWEGNVLGDANSVAKRARGDWTGVLPGKTKRWKEFWGLEFRWVLEECVGAGVVEVFETGAVGWGIRAR